MGPALDTPYAVVDHAKMTRNISRLAARLDPLGVGLRPHVKTAKSVEVARLVHGGRPGPTTVSTLAEAEGFAAAGFTDILYAVGLAPHKLDRVSQLIARGIDVTVLVDNVTVAEAVAAGRVPALIEVDCDGHRGGVDAAGPELLAIGTILDRTDSLRGVLLHAGESYFAYTPEALAHAAANERDVANRAATALRNAGLPCPVVSIGSTPTAHAATDLTGITEVRAGNYVFFDLVMAGLGVCTIDDIALSVVVTVIGHRPDKNWIITDGGWMALSRDRGTSRQSRDQGYGLVAGHPDLIVAEASQEHGILTMRPSAAGPLPELAIGTRLSILPNHACATAAQHTSYQVTNGVQATWPRLQGW